MANQDNVNMIRVQEQDGIAPPPRYLLWIAIGLFVLLIAGGIGAFLFIQNRPPLVTLFDLGLKFAVVLTIGSLILAVLFRKRLPRFLLPVLIVILVLAWLVGSGAFVLVYRNSLAPGQREATKSLLPFMAAFDPPLPPPDTSLPTPVPAQEGDISPADLLNAPLGGKSTPVPTVDAPAMIQIEPSPTLAPTAEPTLIPTAIPTEAPEVTQAAEAADTNVSVQGVSVNNSAVLPASARLFGFTVVKQTWNNCGPANITMALSYYGWTQGQEVAQSYLRPDKEDKNVNPSEIVAFVNEQTGVRALARVGGTMQLLKSFLANNIPIVIETGYMYEGSSWLGHYQTVVGYDDMAGSFYVYDSYLGTGDNGGGLPKLYTDFDRDWEHFNRTFIAVYKQEDENLVRTLLGDWADVNWAAEYAAETAREEARANPQNSFAWNNLGASLARLGKYEEAAVAFDQARRLGTLPWRITLYQFGMFESYYNVQRYDDVLALVNANLNNGGDYIEETYFWRGQVETALGEKTKAAESFRRALQHNPRFAAAQDALNALSA
jgi:hypothetical protein